MIDASLIIKPYNMKQNNSNILIPLPALVRWIKTSVNLA